MTIDKGIYGGLKKILLASGQLDSVIDIFITNADQKLQGLRTAISEDDRAEIKRVAHSIKGSCSMLGGVRCAELCQAIEDACVAGTKTTLSAHTEDLALEIKNMSDFLNADKSGLTPDCCE